MTVDAITRLPSRGMQRPNGIRELVVGAGVLVVLGRFTDGLATWVIAALLAGAVILGALQLFHEADAAETTAVHPRGVPIESLLLSAILALGAVGVVHLVPIGLLQVPLVAAILWLLLRALSLEARLARATTPPSGADHTAVLGLTMVAGLAAFAGVAALIPGALPDPGAVAAGTTQSAATPSLILGLAAVDGLIAFALAYRVAALRSTSVRDVGWAASSGAAIVAIAAAALRTLEIPGLIGPALLVLVFFLWEAIHSGAPARHRDPRRLWESVLLVALGLVVVAWSVGLRG
jgi:hypothetical protein